MTVMLPNSANPNRCMKTRRNNRLNAYPRPALSQWYTHRCELVSRRDFVSQLWYNKAQMHRCYVWVSIWKSAWVYLRHEHYHNESHGSHDTEPKYWLWDAILSTGRLKKTWLWTGYNNLRNCSRKMLGNSYFCRRRSTVSCAESLFQIHGSFI